jgi:hypothetical protein
MYCKVYEEVAAPTLLIGAVHDTDILPIFGPEVVSTFLTWFGIVAGVAL